MGANMSHVSSCASQFVPLLAQNSPVLPQNPHRRQKLLGLQTVCKNDGVNVVVSALGVDDAMSAICYGANTVTLDELEVVEVGCLQVTVIHNRPLRPEWVSGNQDIVVLFRRSIGHIFSNRIFEIFALNSVRTLECG